MKSRGRVMVPVPAKAEFGIQGPAQTLHPNASSNNGTNARQLKTQRKCFVILSHPYEFGNFYHVHQQKIPSHIYKYMDIYCNKIIVNFKIQVDKYLRIHATSKIQSPARNVYFTILATFVRAAWLADITRTNIFLQ